MRVTSDFITMMPSVEGQGSPICRFRALSTLKKALHTQRLKRMYFDLPSSGPIEGKSTTTYSTD